MKTLSGGRFASRGKATHEHHEGAPHPSGPERCKTVTHPLHSPNMGRLGCPYVPTLESVPRFRAISAQISPRHCGAPAAVASHLTGTRCVVSCRLNYPKQRFDG